MADRQDIDALMVGALYGELDAAERTRLDAHLSSHPEDRAAMQGLERTRATVRRGLDVMPAAEPPQAISAMLLQEASRRRAAATATEPAEREGFWDRLLAWFKPIASHPALAAACALILVAGTATALWMRQKGKVVEPTTSSAPAHAELAAAGDRETAQGSGSADDYGVDLSKAVATADEDERADTAGAALEERDRLEASGAAGKGGGSGSGAASTPRGAGKQPVTAPGYIAVDGEDPAPDIKGDEGASLDDQNAEDSLDPKAATTADGSVVVQRVRPEEPSIDSETEEWAQTEHAKLVKLVKDGKCPEAGRVGADLKEKAPEYYAANVANDRDVRQCKSYIEARAKKKAQKNYKSRSQGNAYDESDADVSH